MRVIELFDRRQSVFNDEYEVLKIVKAKGEVAFKNLQDRDKEIVQNLYFQNLVKITNDGIVTLNNIK